MSTANPLGLITDLAREITPALLAAGPRSLRAPLAEAEATQALSRCIASALLALIPSASLESVASIRAFLADPDAIKELAQPLSGLLPNSNELAAIYTETTRQSPAVAGLNFDHGVAAYAAAFASALHHEPALLNLTSLAQDQDTLRAKIQLPDDVQQRLDAATAQISALLNTPNANTLTANDIHAHNVVVGVQQLIHQHFYAERAPKWEEHYLRTLIARCDPLDLLPLSETQVDEQGRPVQSVGISDVFAALHLDGLYKPSKASLAQIATQVTAKNKDPEKILIYATEAVAALPRLVVLGQPGGGKSSLVNHLAVQLAHRRLRQTMSDERLIGWPAEQQPIPIKIVVRELAEWLSQQRGKADVWGYIAYLLGQWGCAECLPELKAHVIAESGLILFDGLDEVRADDAAARRDTIKNAISEFAAPLHRSKVVLTCREYAYQPPNLKDKRPD